MYLQLFVVAHLTTVVRACIGGASYPEYSGCSSPGSSSCAGYSPVASAPSAPNYPSAAGSVPFHSSVSYRTSDVAVAPLGAVSSNIGAYPQGPIVGGQDFGRLGMDQSVQAGYQQAQQGVYAQFPMAVQAQFGAQQTMSQVQALPTEMAQAKSIQQAQLGATSEPQSLPQAVNSPLNQQPLSLQPLPSAMISPPQPPQELPPVSRVELYPEVGGVQPQETVEAGTAQPVEPMNMDWCYDNPEEEGPIAKNANCFVNRGFQCCDQEMFGYLEAMVTKSYQNERWRGCNNQRMVVDIQKMTEDRFNLKFETFVGSDNICGRYTFYKNWMCKTKLMDGRVVLVYAHPVANGFPLDSYVKFDGYANATGYAENVFPV